MGLNGDKNNTNLQGFPVRTQRLYGLSTQSVPIPEGLAAKPRGWQRRLMGKWMMSPVSPFHFYTLSLPYIEGERGNISNIDQSLGQN